MREWLPTRQSSEPRTFHQPQATNINWFLWSVFSWRPSKRLLSIFCIIDVVYCSPVFQCEDVRELTRWETLSACSNEIRYSELAIPSPNNMGVHVAYGDLWLRRMPCDPSTFAQNVCLWVIRITREILAASFWTPLYSVSFEFNWIEVRPEQNFRYENYSCGKKDWVGQLSTYKWQ